MKCIDFVELELVLDRAVGSLLETRADLHGLGRCFGGRGEIDPTPEYAIS